jgi:hypothetical protein
LESKISLKEQKVKVKKKNIEESEEWKK